MIVFWSGWGFLVPIIGLLQLAVMELVVNGLSGAPGYYENHGWPKLLGFLLGGSSIWLLASFLRRRDAGRVLIDKASGREMVLRRSHQFMFIPMIYWAPIFGALGLVFLFVT